MGKNGSGIMNMPPFYLMLVIFLVLGLGFVMLLGIPGEGNIPLIIFALIFGFLSLASITVFDSMRGMPKETFTASSQGLVIGFIAWGMFMSFKHIFAFMGFFQVPVQSALASIQGSIPPFHSFFATVIWSPIAEEFWWAIALPFLTFGVLGKMSSEFNSEMRRSRFS